MSGQIFAPVMQPYDVRVIATYLARAFNGDSMEVPPTRSPVWGLATRMVADMRRDNYSLGAYAGNALLDAQRHHPSADSSPTRQTRMVPRPPSLRARAGGLLVAE